MANTTSQNRYLVLSSTLECKCGIYEIKPHVSNYIKFDNWYQLKSTYMYRTIEHILAGKPVSIDKLPNIYTQEDRQKLLKILDNIKYNIYVVRMFDAGTYKMKILVKSKELVLRYMTEVCTSNAQPLNVYEYLTNFIVHTMNESISSEFKDRTIALYLNYQLTENETNKLLNTVDTVKCEDISGNDLTDAGSILYYLLKELHDSKIYTI